MDHPRDGHRQSEPRLADPDPMQATKANRDAALQTSDLSSATNHTTATSTPTSAATTSSLSPLTSPPASPPATQSPAVADYYSARPKTDRLGNPIPDRRRQGAMASVYENTPAKLPGDLGKNDPRRPKSPAPPTLPGDLGANDPRRPRNISGSPAPAGHDRKTSLEGSEGGVPLQDSPLVPEEDHHESEDDADADDDNDTDLDDSKRGRGRKRPEPGRTTSGKSVNLREASVDSQMDPPYKPDPTKGQSKFSLPKDPKIQITPPVEKKRVHPSTAFDIAASGTSTPLGGSDDESISELRAAQKLSLTMSVIHSTPSAHRVIRQIIRGDYAHFQRQAEEGRKRQRVYLVATDMSPESQYALEWTIGTVLRDGDTLLGVYAMDEESTSAGGTGGGGGVEIGHGAESIRDTAAIVHGLPSTNVPPPPSHGPSPLARGSLSSASAAATGPAPAQTTADSRSRSRNPAASHGPADDSRRRAAEDLTNRTVHLLRKTRLQVRIVVEVFHCKSPRHMITEVIDYLQPTLVIIGSRGRSAVKGVLLGSFSNYLVTKSSVPVMVARKKLRKHGKGAGGGGGSGGGVLGKVGGGSGKEGRNRDGTSVPYSGSGRSGRFSNVIEAPRGKGLRVEGWGEDAASCADSMGFFLPGDDKRSPLSRGTYYELL
ncbi:hypothetical protein LTR87_011467 [Friedmanniomyces endolithicus]|nr:hypothetical protein LTR87_011467 [Friedmanniomyces endolithicus]